MARPVIPTQAASVIAAGVAVGIIGFIAFLGVHAVLIAPIWAGSLQGFPFAILGGLALATAFHASGEALKGFLRIGAFGVGTWLALWPVTLFAAWLRASGLRAPMGNWEMLAELTIAAATGALIGWVTCRTRLGIIVFGTALATLVMVMAGPIAVMNSRRAALLFISFLPIYVVAAFVIAGSRWVVQRRSARASPASLSRSGLRPPPAPGARSQVMVE